MLPFPIISNTNKAPVVNILRDVQATASGNYLLTSSNNLWVTGINSEGQLGLGDQVNRNDNWYLSLSNVGSMYVGSSNVVLVKKLDGTYWRAGRAYAFTGANTVSSSWTDVSSMFSAAVTASGSTITQILCTNENVVLLMANGTVWGTGRNLYGALGTGNTTNLTVFTNLGLTGITKIDSVDQNIYALNGTSGSVFGAGTNTNSQLNTTASSTISTFRTVTTAGTNIWCGGGTTLYVLKADGLYACGNGGNGEMGNGTNTATNLLIRVSTTVLPSEMYMSKAGNGNINAKMSNGVMYVTGYNNYTAGTGTTPSINTWTLSPDKNNSTAITVQGTNRCLLIKSSILYGAGIYNSTYPYLLPKFTANVTTISILDITGVS